MAAPRMAANSVRTAVEALRVPLRLSPRPTSRPGSSFPSVALLHTPFSAQLHTSPSHSSTSPTPSTSPSSSTSSSSSSSTTTTTPPSASESHPSIPPTPASATPRSAYAVQAGIILTRPPLLTREPTDFENSFFFYQKRLNERLTLPFSQRFYFKRDTPAQLDWAIKLRERKGIVAREVGPYNGKGRLAWNDEIKVDDPLSSRESLLESILHDAQQRVSDDAEEIPEADRVPVERPLPRTTEADEKNDVQRLDRKLDRTLYLVVKTKDGKWEFPADQLRHDEALHETARRVLDSAAGVNMNTWIVGRVPVAHLVREPEDASPASGSKTFFLKGRIMAGQADVRGNPYGYADFQWLTREELAHRFDEAYLRSVQKMMADL